MKHVTFEIAKLLKEKGFSWECKDFYTKTNHEKKFYMSTGIEYGSDRDCIWDWNLNGGKSGMLSKVIPYPNNSDQIYYSAPIISDVVDWIYEKHGIWIHVHQEVKLNGLEIINTGKFQGMITRINHTSIFGKKSQGDIPEGNYRKPVKTPSEAYLAGIEYTLNNLI